MLVKSLFGCAAIYQLFCLCFLRHLVNWFPSSEVHKHNKQLSAKAADDCWVSTVTKPHHTQARQHRRATMRLQSFDVIHKLRHTSAFEIVRPLHSAFVSACTYWRYPQGSDNMRYIC
ncbi:hypothetical protein B0J14DRAFT_17689 [Halenospora varia]|nr:hypothetical protein B0J14DRAFT_17689 [Halenospora varia]